MSRKALKKDFFMGAAKLASKLSTCARRQVGAVIVKNNYVISTGYNGAPVGGYHCIDNAEGRECTRGSSKSGENLSLCRATHAEANALVTAAKLGISTDGADVYCTLEPCNECYKLMKNAGIRTVYFIEPYPDEYPVRDNFNENGFSVKYLNVEVRN